MARTMTTMTRWMTGLGVGLLAIGCGGSPDGAEEATDGTTEDPLLAGRHLHESEVASLLRSVGFSASVVPKMVCVAKYESSFYEQATNKNRNGTIDRGLFQINSIHVGRTAGCPSSSAALFTAATNARCAHAIYQSEGANAWYGYQKHRAECNAAR